MEPVKITQKEAKMLKWYSKFPWHLVTLLVILILTAGFFYYLIAIWGESKVTSIFVTVEEPCPGIQEHVKGLFDKIISVFFQPAFLFLEIIHHTNCQLGDGGRYASKRNENSR